MDEEIEIEDCSGDKKYFTQVPNCILNHSTAVAQALYLQLKRLAGDNGKAYPGSRYLMGKLSISRNTLKKEMNYLINKGWIKYDGDVDIQTDGGKQKIKSYRIVDIWKINIEEYERGVKIEPPRQRGVKIEPQGVSTRGVKIDAKEEPLKQEPSIKKNIISEPQADSHINELMDLFYKFNPSINFGNKTQRSAIDWLIKKAGVEKSINTINYALKIQGEKYAPVITTPLQLKNKLGELIVYSKKENGKENSICRIS